MEPDQAILEALDRLQARGVNTDVAKFNPLGSSPLYYDRAGRPITLGLYAVLFEDDDYRQVAHDEVSEGIRVSTIWLGVDHGFGRGPKRLFETMVFVELEEPRRLALFDREIHEEGTEGYRWETEADALAGHHVIVTELRSQIPE